MTEAGRIVGLYERHAAAWDAARGADPALERHWLERFLALLPVPATVLDLGCGSGRPLAGALRARGCRIVGVDTSPSLLARCRERFPAEEWLLDDMRTLALGRRFAGILAWDSFFHLDHDAQRRMFATFAAHAAPRGVLMFTSGPAHGVSVGSFEGEPLYHASLAPAEYRALLAAHGFAVVDHVVEDPGCGHHTVWLAQADGTAAGR